MKRTGNIFISYLICLTFLFRLLVISFIPGSTTTLFPHTVSFKYKGLGSFQKRRRNIENFNSIFEFVNGAEVPLLSEEIERAEKKLLTEKWARLIFGFVNGFLKCLNIENLRSNLNSRAYCLSFVLEQRKNISAAILRI